MEVQIWPEQEFRSHLQLGWLWATPRTRVSVSPVYRKENEGSAWMVRQGGTLESSQFIPPLCR